MPMCSWCLRDAFYRDNLLHFACVEHKPKLMTSIREAVRDFDHLASEYSKHRSRRDEHDLASRRG